MISKSPISRKTDDGYAIHYVYVWINHFFRTHRVVNSKLAKPLMVKYSGVGCAVVFYELSARERVRSGKKFFWHGIAFKTENDQTFINNEGLSISKLFYFISLRSGYLSLWCEDYHIVESYSPHSFSRCFEFYQDILGDLKERIHTGSLEEMYQFYQSLTHCKTSSKVFVPAYSTDFGSQVTHGHEEWWQKVCGDDFTKGTELLTKIAFGLVTPLVKSKPRKVQKEQSIQNASHTHLKFLVVMPPLENDCKSKDSSKTNMTIQHLSEKHSDNIQLNMAIEVLDGDTHSDSDLCWKHFKKNVIECYQCR